MASAAGAGASRRALSAGISDALRKAGVVEGETVCIGEVEMEWSDDQSEGSVYGAWLESQKGRARQGGARWPRPKGPQKTSKKQLIQSA